MEYEAIFVKNLQPLFLLQVMNYDFKILPHSLYHLIFPTAHKGRQPKYFNFTDKEIRIQEGIQLIYVQSQGLTFDLPSGFWLLLVVVVVFFVCLFSGGCLFVFSLVLSPKFYHSIDL